MGFDPKTIALKSPWLSAGLKIRIAEYFARPVPAGEVPLIDGDPFTDTQEYPNRFAVDISQIQDEKARVQVSFAGYRFFRRVNYELVYENGTWQIDELGYEQGESLGSLIGK